jgi:hypothetical protein
MKDLSFPKKKNKKIINLQKEKEKEKLNKS